MLRKLVLLALSSGLIKKIYDKYKAQEVRARVPAPVVTKPGAGDPRS